jgi:hypothetical protein
MRWIYILVALAGCSRGGGDAHDLATGAAADLGAGVGGNGGAADLAAPTGGDDLAAPAGGGDLARGPDDLAHGPADLARAPVDLAHAPHDLARPPYDLAQPPPDLGRPTSTDVLVHVYIDNSCNTTTVPRVIDAPLNIPLNLTFENDSHDYDADLWSSRGYGELGLGQGAQWKDPIQHCLNPTPYTEYFDVGIHGGPLGGSCPNDRLEIHCN